MTVSSFIVSASAQAEIMESIPLERRLVAFSFIVACMIGALFVCGILMKALRNRYFNKNWFMATSGTITFVIFILLVSLALYLIFWVCLPEIKFWSSDISKFVFSGVIFVECFGAIEVTGFVRQEKMKNLDSDPKTNNKTSEIYMLLLVQIAMFIIGFIGLFKVWKFDLTSSTIILGAVSLAISLAVKNTVTDLISGLLIVFTGSFLIGDIIRIAEIEGKLEIISVLSSKIRIDDHCVITIPNSKLRKDIVVNLSREIKIEQKNKE